MRGKFLIGLMAASIFLSPSACFADGCFVFRWNKQFDIGEPTQKAIILHDNGRENLVLQVKYEGPPEEFGWLVPVPGLQEVRKGSMDCFYELSRLTQEQFGESISSLGRGATMSQAASEAVKVIEIKTVGAYEVAVLAAGDSGKLAGWLDANNFVFPKDKRDVLDTYVKKGWYFVAIKIDPNQSEFVLVKGSPKRGVVQKSIAESTREKLANGELHPLIISFDSAQCVFPLGISAVNGKPSEISLYVLSSEPLISRTIFDKKFAGYLQERVKWIEARSHDAERREEIEERRDARIAEMQKQLGTNSFRRRPFANWIDDPADPRPPLSVMRQFGLERPFPDRTNTEFEAGTDLLLSTEPALSNLTACAKELPRLKGKSWCLTKQVQTFLPSEMRDLEFEPAIPVLSEKLRSAEGEGVVISLARLGARSLPVVIAAAQSSDPTERRIAAATLAQMGNVGNPTVLSALLDDPDPRTRVHAIYAAAENWDSSFAPRLVQLFKDSDLQVRGAAGWVMREHRDDSLTPTYRKMIDEDGVAAAEAILSIDSSTFSRAELIHLFSSTNLSVVSTAFTRLRSTLSLDELAPLFTNSLPMARMMGLGELVHIGDKKAVDRIISMLRDSNEGVRWYVRSDLRRLTGQLLGADPASYEKWWAENKEAFVPQPRAQDRFGRQVE
jgi:HEAT repeat protein